MVQYSDLDTLLASLHHFIEAPGESCAKSVMVLLLIIYPLHKTLNHRPYLDLRSAGLDQLHSVFSCSSFCVQTSAAQ